MLLAQLLLLAQAAVLQPGANPSPQAESALPIPRPKKARRPALPPAAPVPSVEQDRLTLCKAKVRSDPAGAAGEAQAWLDERPGQAGQMAARLCLGLAQSALLQWEAAEQTFTALAMATDAQKQSEEAAAYRAMAGTAAIAAGYPDRAIVWLDQAVASGMTLPAAQLGGIQMDRARALVALGRLDDARKALNEVQRLAPDSAEGWLLSATLNRRMRNLAAAQADIEKAAALDPTDPATGLEAGVIAMLGGREAAARKSWDSVIATAPGSNEARIAEGYLKQIGPETQSAPQPGQPKGKAPSTEKAPSMEKPRP